MSRLGLVLLVVFGFLSFGREDVGGWRAAVGAGFRETTTTWTIGCDLYDH